MIPNHTKKGRTAKGFKSNGHSGCQQRRDILWPMKLCLCYCFTILTTILELPELLRSFSSRWGGGLFCLLSGFYREACFTLSVISHLCLLPCSFPQQFRNPNMLISVLHIQADNTLQLSERQTLPSQVSQPGMTKSSTRKGNNRPDFVPTNKYFLWF